ncbi:hypothetical protein ACTQ5X_05805 [Jeotgalibaca porci]|uniref:hypothetical protein n=1 Tax=Jeotgalibaca porci TaxID=1868793 RepID=UPI003F8DA97F
MKKTIYINENYRFIQSDDDINEGGFSRNYFLMRWIQNNIVKLEEIKLGRKRIINTFRVYYQLLKPIRTSIIFQYPLLGIPIFNKNIIVKFNADLLLFVLKLISKRKDIIFDISDLKYEQSIDLKINANNLARMKEFEEKFFRLPAKFVFASDSMRKYAHEKYGISYTKSDTCKNGGKILSHKSKVDLDTSYIDETKMNFVYAGSLNKGRQIEIMIDNFPNDKNIHLYIMGNDGEWVTSYCKQDNITYLGALREEDAHFISSKCDVGLIPYDENKMYYNIAYPTKLSFYITAGIPFLSTPVKEALNIESIYKVGFTRKMSEWASFLSKIDKGTIAEEKEKITDIQNQFTWEFLFNECKTFKNLIDIIN